MVHQNLNSFILTGNEIEAKIRWVISSVLLAAVHVLLCCLVKARSIFENTHVLLLYRNLMNIVSVFLDFSPVDMLINDSLEDWHRNTNLVCMEKRNKMKIISVLKADWIITWTFFCAHISPEKFSPCENLKSRMSMQQLPPSLSLIFHLHGGQPLIIFYEYMIVCPVTEDILPDWFLHRQALQRSCLELIKGMC